MLENPPRRLFRKTALAGASDDHRDDGHVFAPALGIKL
jgi:hypothetical protein